MFFTLEQIRYNRESDRRRQAFVEQMQQDFQAERERRYAQQAEHQQQLITLLAQNQQMYARLLDLLERRIGQTDAPSD